MGLSIWEGNKAKDSVEALQTIAQMQLLEAQYYGLIPISDWNVIKQVLNDGKGPTLLPVGYQIVDEWVPSGGGNPLNSVWDVVNYDESGNVELNWHYAFPDSMPFDVPEAIYYAPSGGLAAGQYYITISAAFGSGWVGGHHINFTLTSAMAEGDQLYIDCGINSVNDPTAGRTWNVYAKGSTVSKQNGTTSDSDTGTELGATNANSVLPNGQINAPQRVIYGYYRWSQSAVRQYLNSAGAAGTWWSAQNPWDRPPTQAETVRGWLGGCSDNFVANISASAVVTDLNTEDATAESKTTDTTYDKIYLPCLENWYINPELAGEGNEWEYYKELAEEAGLSGKFQRSSTYPILIKYILNTQPYPVVVWLRSCNRINAYYTWNVNAAGRSNVYYAYGAYRGCPACKILKST